MTMQILDWNSLDAAARRQALARPQLDSAGDIEMLARSIIREVRKDGDVALLAYAERFDRARLSTLAVTGAEFDHAEKQLDAKQVAAIETAIDNVRRFHAAQLAAPLSMDVMPGVRCERLYRPIPAVGLYVPAGSAPLPSTVIMVAVPAQLVGCPQRVLCTPPAADGRANAAVLVAARRCGVTQVFKAGGAQAIAAMAYGTRTVPKVDKIFGPGTALTTAAKQIVAADPNGAACDMPAGPSEVLVIADGAASPAFVAADLLAQAEHDVRAQAILVTDSAALAAAVAGEFDRQRRSLSRGSILSQSSANCRAIVVPDIATALAVSNDYAPEHLIVQTAEPRALLDGILNAGSVFLGAWSPESMGDYCSGTNHVLPTYGYARAYSGLSITDFQKRMTVQELSADGLRRLGPVAETLANLEGLDAHARAVTLRLDSLAGSS
ncbi:MAG TPA: histidinol dehydrogenase [Steroidobacteraceae bacterium]|nr:histidinol dehydrogenase [Steroidobacteraceae bacterium]